MKVTKTDIDALNAILKIEVKKEDFEPKVMKSLKDYRKKAEMKGFRKGQVPIGMIKKMYGNSVLMDTVNNLLSDEVNNFIKENNLEILGHPIPKEGQTFSMDIKSLGDFTFEYELGLSPEVKLDFLESKPTFEREIPKVEDKMLDEEVTRMQKQLGVLESVDTIEEDTDILSVNIAELDENNTLKEDGITNSTSISLELIKDKKVAKTIKKLKKGEIIDIDIFNTFTQDNEAIKKHILATDEEVKEDAKYRMTIEDIKRIKLAEIDESFMKKAFGEETGLKDEKDLRAKIKSDLEDYFSKQADNKMFNDIYKKMIEETKLEFPDAFMKRWIKLTNENSITDEQIEEEYPSFVDNLKWSLIVKKIKNDAKIEISNEELKEKTAEGIRAQMMQYGMANFAGPEMDSFVANMMAREDHVNQTKDAILEEKIFQYLKTKINIKDIKVSLEEFNKQAELVNQ